MTMGPRDKSPLPAPRKRRMRPAAFTFLALAGAAALSGLAPARAAEPPTFHHHVRALFERRCTSCHGEEKKKAGLDLRTLASIMTGAESGQVVQPGAPASSLLMQMLDSDEMPSAGDPLSPEEKALVRDWIARGTFPAGAASATERVITDADRAHWAFRPVRRPAPPRVRKSAGQVRTPIDAFVLARLEARGWRMSREADRRTLIRRASFDLVGLPPAPEEVAAFERDRRPDAYERLIDRLLASPHYGERWGRHWLDVAGYSDSSGNAPDELRPASWKYRDWVVRALNADMPYDRFLVEQMAGDQLVNHEPGTRPRPADVGALTATGFLRLVPDLSDNQKIYQVDKWYDALTAITETATKVVMGLQFGCARCHDHKFDPITQADYFRLMAPFRAAFDPERWVAANVSYADPWPNRYIVDASDGVTRFRDVIERAPKNGRADSLREAGLPLIWATWDVSKTPSPTRRLVRGNYLAPAETIEPGVPSVLDDPKNPFRFPEPDPAWHHTGRRLTLARWLVRPEHPLTARVMANRIWQFHFGEGIVRTPDDLGTQGAPPSHPELLDWLASELVANGWRWKPLHRQIMLSHVYRQSAGAGGSTGGIGDGNAEAGGNDKDVAAKLAADPENRLLWRRQSLRLEAEAIRDAMLAVAGLLDRTLYGSYVTLSRAADGQQIIKPGTPGENRRSLYIASRRKSPYGFMQAFDAPSMDNGNMAQRFRAALPKQALALMNNPLVLRSAEALAERVRKDARHDGVAIERLWRLAFGRPPGRAEIELARQVTGDGSGLRELCQAVLAASEFLYVF